MGQNKFANMLAKNIKLKNCYLQYEKTIPQSDQKIPQ